MRKERRICLVGGVICCSDQSNPIHQKVPVLLDNGKPLCESAIIVSYLDEKWPSPPLLPSCACARYQARFWADFIDKKLFEATTGIWKTKGDALEMAKKDFLEVLKALEGALGDKDFLAGDEFGFVDIIAIPITGWFLASERFGDFTVEAECPKISAWIKRCMQREAVAKVILSQKKPMNLLSCSGRCKGLSK